MPGKTFINFSISFSVVYLPRLTLKDPCASSGFNPVASKTWLGSNLKDEQADPVEQAMPSKSKRITNDSPSINLNLKFALFASRFLGWPFSLESFIFKTDFINLTLNFKMRDVSYFISFLHISAALAKPTMAGIFAVELLRPFSWPPPCKIGSILTPSLIYRRATPFGPYIL